MLACWGLSRASLVCCRGCCIEFVGCGARHHAPVRPATVPAMPASQDAARVVELSCAADAAAVDADRVAAAKALACVRGPGVAAGGQRAGGHQPGGPGCRHLAFPMVPHNSWGAIPRPAAAQQRPYYCGRLISCEQIVLPRCPPFGCLPLRHWMHQGSAEP